MIDAKKVVERAAIIYGMPLSAQAQAATRAIVEALNEALKDKPAKLPSKFTKPTQIEVEAYVKEIGLPQAEAVAFYDWFESNGWKIGGKTLMKCYKAALRTWKRRRSQEFPEASTPTVADAKLFMGRWSADKPPTRNEFSSQSSYETHLEKFNKWKVGK